MISLLHGLSLVEWTIVGFIGANMTLSGVYLLQCGFRRMGEVEHQ